MVRAICHIKWHRNNRCQTISAETQLQFIHTFISLHLKTLLLLSAVSVSHPHRLQFPPSPPIKKLPHAKCMGQFFYWWRWGVTVCRHVQSGTAYLTCFKENHLSFYHVAIVSFTKLDQNADQFSTNQTMNNGPSLD